jgi:hypothetical protein
MHFKRVKRELRVTKNEIEEKSRKRMSEEFYADVGPSNLYDGVDLGHDLGKSIDYDVTYDTLNEDNGYVQGPIANKDHPAYLDMSVCQKNINK